MLAGEGYREAWLASNGPVTHFPPAYPAVLAFLGWFGLDPLRGARLLAAVLFGLNTALLGILGWRMTRWLPAGLLLSLLFVSNDSLLAAACLGAQRTAVHLPESAGLLDVRPVSRARRSLALAGGVWNARRRRLPHPLCRARPGCHVCDCPAHCAQNLAPALRQPRASSLPALPRGWSAGRSATPLSAARPPTGFSSGIPSLNPILTPPGAHFAGFLLPVESWRQAVVRSQWLLPTFVLLMASELALGWSSDCGRSAAPERPKRPEILSLLNGLYVFGYHGFHSRRDVSLRRLDQVQAANSCARIREPDCSARGSGCLGLEAPPRHW